MLEKKCSNTSYKVKWIFTGKVFTYIFFILDKTQQFIACNIGNLLMKIYRLNTYPKYLPSKLKCKKYMRYESKSQCPQLPDRASQKFDIFRTNGDGPYPGAFLAAC